MKAIYIHVITVIMRESRSSVHLQLFACTTNNVMYIIITHVFMSSVYILISVHLSVCQAQNIKLHSYNNYCVMGHMLTMTI